MRVVARLNLSGKTVGSPPSGVSAADWKQFHKDIADAHAKWNPQFMTDDKSEEKVESALADAASAPDQYADDIHLFYKPTNAGGMSVINKLADEAVKAGAAAVLVPLICGASCLGELLHIGGSGTCKKCIKKAKELSEDVPTPSDLMNLIPGFGDISDKKYTGVWHFINIADAPYIMNTYDDHQGLLYEASGPAMLPAPGVYDIGIMAVTDTLGMSVNPDKSDGVKRYQISDANDGFPDESYNDTMKRSSAEWQKYAMGHIAFEPVDNLAFWGWREFRDNGHGTGPLGYTLHAIGDATVPMHVTGTTSWGHRPYEDAQENLWDKISSALDDQAILARAFKYYQEIKNWRASGHTNDIPVRHLVRTVAKHTLEYSIKENAATGGSWPFDDNASLHYLYGDEISPEVAKIFKLKEDSIEGPQAKQEAINTYANRTDAVDLVKPLFEDGIAAELVVLTFALKKDATSQLSPSPSGAALALNHTDWLGDLSQTSTSFYSHFDNSQRARVQPADTPAQAKIFETVRINYALLGRQLILDEISPAEYLQRVRNQNNRANAARKDRALAEELARGDADGDLVPDARDRCPNTPALTATDAQGCPTRERLPNAPSRREMQDFFSRFNIMVNPKCESAPAPETPRLQKIGTSSANRDLLFAVSPPAAQPGGCPIYYEFDIEFLGVLEGDKSILPGDAYREFVFSSAQRDPKLSDQKRIVFRVPREPAPKSDDQNFLLKAWGRYNNYKWRARAVSANGLSSSWSNWQKVSKITFGEP